MDTICALLELREWESEHFPLCSSIGQSVFAYIAKQHLSGNTPTVKQLIHDLEGYSRAGIRLQLKRLEAEGWIELTNGMSDARNRHVATTSKLDHLPHAYKSEVRKKLVETSK